MITREQQEAAAKRLREAARLIEEVGWTQGASARNEAGEPVSCYGADVRAFCGLGAFWRSAKSIYGGSIAGLLAMDIVFSRAFGTAAEPYVGAIDANDRPDMTAARIAALLREAAGLCETHDLSWASSRSELGWWKNCMKERPNGGSA